MSRGPGDDGAPAPEHLERATPDVEDKPPPTPKLSPQSAAAITLPAVDIEALAADAVDLEALAAAEQRAPSPLRAPTMSPQSAAAITLPAVDLEALAAAEQRAPSSPRAPTMSPQSAAAITLPAVDLEALAATDKAPRPPRVSSAQTARPAAAKMIRQSAAAITLPAPDASDNPRVEPSRQPKIKTASSVAITLPPDEAFDDAAASPSRSPSPSPSPVSAHVGATVGSISDAPSSGNAAFAATVAPNEVANANANANANDATLPANDPSRDLPSFGVVDGNAYMLGTEIARGGMGRILAARDRRLRRDVVIKVLHTRDTPSARFEREALITARLQHPSIVRIYDAGRLDGQRPFYSMERVRGQSLDRVIAGATDVRARLALLPHVIAIADALAYAHNESVIHRDLKPANVLVGSYGETVVIDWGLAKDLRTAGSDSVERVRLPSIPPDLDSGGDLTIAGSVMGTPAYMAPEQARGEPADARSDVYAIGAILYTVLSGKQAVHGSTATEILDRVAAGTITPLRDHVPNAPPELVTIVEHAMALDPEARFATAKELAEELRRYAAGKLVASHAYTFGALLRRWVRRHRAVLGVAAFAVVVLSALLVLGVRRIVRERDRAAKSEIAEREAKQRVEENYDNFMLGQAKAARSMDPSRTAAWLLQSTDLGMAREETRALAESAVAAGVAFELVGSGDDIEHVVVTADGRTAYSGGDDGAIWRWSLDIHAGQQLGAHGSSVEAIQLSRDGRFLASGGTDDIVWLWDLASSQGIQLVGHTGAVRGVAFSPDDRWLASTGEDNAIWLWDLETREGRRVFDGDHPLRPVVWNHDSRRLWAGAGNGHVISLQIDEPFWIIPAPITSLSTLRVHGGETRALALSPDGTQLASGGEDGAVYVWSVASREQRPRKLVSHADVARDVLWTPDGNQLVSAGGDPFVRVTDVASGVSRELLGNRSGVKDLALGADGTLVVAAGIDGAVRVWSVAGGEPRTFVGHRGGIKSVVFGPQSRFVISASDDDRLRYWPLAKPEPAPHGPALRAWLASRTNVKTEDEASVEPRREGDSDE